ncbi:MAG: hypothetical protein K9J17_05710 [Flavobacteriales bacterium]|nr:hypothetical protein [Flavobacteriales bacterium]
MSRPFLSIVIAIRNDDYGGEFRERLQMFVSWTVKNLKKNGISSELIFVNYNPVPYNEPIQRFISWPVSEGNVEVKVITVLPEIHEKFVTQTGVKPVPFVEYLAKNVGIRRANGDFLLVMNPDVLLSTDLFPCLMNLRAGKYYRANRIDFSNREFELDGTGPSEQLSESAFKIWFKGQEVSIAGYDWLSYLFLWFWVSVSNKWRSSTIYLRPFLDLLRIPVYYDRIEYQRHCNASGDFMLMERKVWLELGGYDQISRISLHVDSMMVLRASEYGLKERTFFKPIFHKEHERRFDAKVSGKSDQEMAHREFRQKIEKLLKTGDARSGNPQDWGLANYDLPVMTLK